MRRSFNVLCGMWGHHFVRRFGLVYCLHCGKRIDGGTAGLDLDPDPNEGRRLADDLPGSY